eukprot:g11899.t1
MYFMLLLFTVICVEGISSSIGSAGEECDVDLFLVMPRVIWLRGLSKPPQQIQVFKSLLPHRFHDPSLVGESWNVDEELGNFVLFFRHVNSTLMSNWRAEILVKRVVLGDGDAEKEEIYGSLSSTSREQAESAVEELTTMGKSFCTGHCAEDWNQFAGILIQCLSGERKKDSTQMQSSGSALLRRILRSTWLLPE